ncbi:MAG: L-threonylcarbamoyladenylate synthase, partial [Phycisphaerales bacterium]|nr:L-threonylcarbamoyladenylate synthase [Phycisphaerales bacterium]
VEADRLADRFWPGPLTLVLPKAPDLPDIVTAGGRTVGVRMPDHPLALALIESFGGPIVGPSANPSGYVSPTTAGHVRDHFDEATVYVLDGGACRAGIESTVLDLTRTVPIVLRRGVIGAGEIAGVLGCEVDEPPGETTEPSGEAVASPGVLGPHYQPRSCVMVVERPEDIERALETAAGPAAVLSGPGRPTRVGPPNIVFQMPFSAVAYAGSLYAVLREADATRPALIIVVLPRSDDSPIWRAVRDRLMRAAAPGL